MSSSTSTAGRSRASRASASQSWTVSRSSGGPCATWNCPRPPSRLCTAIGLVGHLTVQAFRTPTGVAFIEINPRYGGAANLGFEAGAPTPEYAIRAARGERLEPRLGMYEVGLMMFRHAADLFVRDVDLIEPGATR